MAIVHLFKHYNLLLIKLAYCLELLFGCLFLSSNIFLWLLKEATDYMRPVFINTMTYEWNIVDVK